jgi:S-adenosylmethionine hydrolase
MILLFTDFGIAGPYIGEMKLALYRHAPGVPIVDLIADVPPFRPLEAAYLLAALTHGAPTGSVYLCVIDPGVGSARLPVIVKADDYWYVGPENGLLDVVASRARQHGFWEIEWRPDVMSQSFHGRDLFAPVAGMLAMGQTPDKIGCRALDRRLDNVPADCPRVIYIDHFGNAMTGLTANAVADRARLEVAGRRIERAGTFSDVPPGTPIWYENSSGLVEIAVNQGSAAEVVGLSVGDSVEVRLDPSPSGGG